MALANLGSVAARVLARIENVPTSISGELLSIVDEERLGMEAFLGVTVGSTGIAETYQPALIRLSMASVLESMKLTGADVSTVQIGDFSMSKGRESNVSDAADDLREDAHALMRALGTKLTFKRAIG